MRRNYSVIGTKYVCFNGINLTDLFIIDQVQLENMPQATVSSIRIPGRAGERFGTGNYGIRHGSMRVSLNTGEHDRVKSINAYKNPLDLFFTDGPKKLDLGEFFVNAFFVASSGYEQVGIYGSDVLSFECYDPYLYYEEKSHSLARGTNSIYCTSPLEVFPTITISGASPTLNITNNDTGERVVIPSGFTSSQTMTVDMERERCTVNGNYIAVSNDLTEFFTLQPGTNNITLSSGSGTLKYRERRL